MDIIGAMDEQIYIEQQTNTVAGNGERLTSWIPYLICWAERKYTGGGEETEAHELVGINKQVFRVRFDSGINSTMRVRDSSNNIFDIRHVEVVDRRAFSILTCEWRDRIEYTT